MMYIFSFTLLCNKDFMIENFFQIAAYSCNDFIWKSYYNTKNVYLKIMVTVEGVFPFGIVFELVFS